MSSNGGLDDALRAFAQHSLRMHRLTRNHALNSYWHHSREIIDNGFLAFVLRGSLAWQSDRAGKVKTADGHVWLQSRYFDPSDSEGDMDHLRAFMQWQLNLYEIWGGLKVELDVKDEVAAKTLLESSITDISLVCDLASLDTDSSMTWYPARYLEVHVGPQQAQQTEHPEVRKQWMCLPLARLQEEMVSSPVDDQWVEERLFALFKGIQGLTDPSLVAVLRRAISWQAEGNHRANVLNGFLNYWQAIELLTWYFYSRLGPSTLGLPTKAERQQQIWAILSSPINTSNYMEIANRCSQSLGPALREVMETTIPYITAGSVSVERLFVPIEGTSTNYYDLRNDIAHGRFSDHELEFTDLVEQHLPIVRSHARIVILAALANADRLCGELNGDGAT